MTEQPTPPDLSVVDRWLEETGSSLGASEAHGLLCGVLSAGGLTDRRRWFEQLAPGLAGSAGLNALFDETVRQLNDSNLGFQLLLPGDDASLAERAEALAQWTQGFLYGFGVGGGRPDDAMPEEVVDFLHDLAEVAKVDFDTDDAGEEEEQALFEIVEFIRMGVLMLNEELHPVETPPNQRPH